jgi:hypothetical protein
MYIKEEVDRKVKKDTWSDTRSCACIDQGMIILYKL